MDVVVVESPAKAKTINKYLGNGYKVLASYGHVRDLPAKDGSVKPDQDFAMAWELTDRSEKSVKEIVNALKGAATLYLATDPDREGEAISWHIEEILKQRAALKGIDVKRVVFNEITADAVREAFRHPRELHNELIEAYLARRALDYLVGFTLSPVLWRKLPGARSAGRVQSVALRLVCERETEIEAFKPQEYWSIAVSMKSAQGDPFLARLTHLNGEKLDKFSIGDETAATAAKTEIETQAFRVGNIEKQRIRRRPQPPFTTSTLQQEASRKLRFSATQTMRVAQRLYEGVDLGGETVGLITYMRTDSVVLSQDALRNSRELISEDYGGRYLPESARIYKTKAKNAQEAHEAIRPTDFFRRPASLAGALKEDEKKLYDLIWRRTVAAEMADAELDKTAVDLPSADHKTRLRANGSVIAFDGFLKLYREDKDDAPNAAQEQDDEDRRLPHLTEGESTEKLSIEPSQHFTQPPPRYGEASLVRRLEELGIGRPSTYASILQVLQDREYVVLDRRRFVPEDKGRIVTTFLTSFFKRYVEYDFTAKLEEQLDDISGGRIEWKQVLRDFWGAFSATVAETKELRTRAVIDALDAELEQHFFPPRENGTNPRSCPGCGDGRLGLKVGRHGPFIGCANYPDCKYTRRMTDNGDGADDDEMAAGPKVLGQDPKSGKEISLRKGPYGPYVQLGEEELDGKKKIKPKRTSIPKGISAPEINLETAIKLLALPRDIGKHPEDGVMMQAGLGRFGPFVKHGPTYASLQDPMEVMTVGVNRAVALLAEKKSRGGQSATPLREVGAHPKDGKPINLYAGRYGPYVKHGRINASIARGREPESVTLEEAVQLLDARAAKGKSKKPAPKRPTAPKQPAAKKRTATKKAPAKKATAKKATAKKATTKKTTTRKTSATKRKAKAGAD